MSGAAPDAGTSPNAPCTNLTVDEHVLGLGHQLVSSQSGAPLTDSVEVECGATPVADDSPESAAAPRASVHVLVNMPPKPNVASPLASPTSPSLPVVGAKRMSLHEFAQGEFFQDAALTALVQLETLSALDFDVRRLLVLTRRLLVFLLLFT